MSDTSEVPDLETPDDVVEGAALEQLGRNLDLGLDLTPEEQVDFDANIERLRRLGYGEAEPEQPDEHEEDEEEELEEPPPPPVDAPEEPPAAAPVAPTPPPTVDLAGTQVSAAEARNLLDLQNYLRANPAVAAQFSELVARQQRGEPLTPPAEEPLPDWIDEDDAPTVAMWRNQQQLRQEMIDLRAATEAQQRAAQEAATRTETMAALSNWASSHPELDEPAVDKVRLEAASLRIIPGLMEQYGAVAPAIAKALDLAYYSMPEFRPSQPDPAPKAAERKRKISSISGSSAGSIRTTKPKPLSYEEMRVEAAKFIAENDLG